MNNPTTKMSKNTKMAIGAVVLVIIIALIVRGGALKKSAPSDSSSQSVVEQPSTNSTTPVYKSKTATTPVDTRTYVELLAAYKGRTFQFATSCQVHMNNQVFKVGSEILLDNRNGVPVAVKIDNNTYNLGAYGYEVISLNNIGKFLIDCNSYENVATITVQQ